MFWKVGPKRFGRWVQNVLEGGSKTFWKVGPKRFGRWVQNVLDPVFFRVQNVLEGIPKHRVQSVLEGGSKTFWKVGPSCVGPWGPHVLGGGSNMF